MLIQICEWLAKLPKLIAEGDTLRAGSRRKRIGHELVGLHQVISRLSENASSIEHGFKALVDASTDDRDWLAHRIVPDLKEAVASQRVELAHASALLTRHQPFLEIYGHRLWEHISEIAVGKGTLLEILSWALRDRKEDTLVLPRTFDLTKLDCFAGRVSRKALDDLPLMRFHGEHRLIDFLVVELPSTEPALGKLTDHAQKLLSEIGKLNSSKSLQDTAGELANVIRLNFKVEELF